MLRTLDKTYSRTFLAGDEASIVDFFNSQNEKLAGFAPRTVEYWRWCCLSRPGVDQNGIYLIKNGQEIVGYIVVGKSGDVWELCYDHQGNGREIVSSLLNWAVGYAKSLGCDSVELNAYARDNVVRDVCQELDFAESHPEPMYLSVIDLPELIRSVLTAKVAGRDFDEDFWFILKNCPPWCVDRFGIRLGEDGVTILKEPVVFPKTTIIADMSTLVALMFGEKSVSKAILTSNVRVHPFWKIINVEKFLRRLEINTPWVVPRADIG